MEAVRFGYKEKLSTNRINLEIFACTIILLMTSMLKYLFVDINISDIDNFDYMLKVLYIFLISASSSVLWDFLFYIYKLFGKKKISFKEYLFKVYSSFSFVSGGIIALLLPIGIELYLVPLVTFISIVIDKLAFGGYGNNLINSSLLGIVVVGLVFNPSYYLGNVREDITSNIELITTPLFETISFPETFNNFYNSSAINLTQIFNGYYLGEIGTTNSFALLIIFVYLLGSRINNLRLSVTYLLSYFILSLLLFGLSKNNLSMLLHNSFSYVIVGPILFMSIFIIPDSVTSPLTRGGKVSYALIMSLVTFYLRLLFNSTYYIYIGVLGINLISSIISRYIAYKRNTKLEYISLIVLSTISIASIFVYLWLKNMLFFQL